ncbi:hypothetical protein [Pseudorhodoferax sp. Leaf274]|uniref:hypothetical protein n=1 Tax=Pseudorhodoferax sp. Leaf274 TaxID=1736318 RepID=UPI0012E1D46B|nr:hypothetical protein [Pseudorhodoferax sp. Leaf274]
MQSALSQAGVTDQGVRPLARAGDFHPGAVLVLAFSQVLGAWIAADILFVGIVSSGNAVLQPLLRCRLVPLRAYGAILLITGWAVAMQVGFSCNLDHSWSELLACASHPRRGLVAACMATSSVLVLSALVRKDRMVRTMLRLGINRQLLWVIFTIPIFGQALLHASKKSTILMRGRYPECIAPIRWMRLKVAILTSSLVKTLVRHFYSREAVSTRVRDSAEAPVFLDSENLRGGDFVILAAAGLSLLVAFQL